MLSDITLFDPRVWDLFWATLTGMLPWLQHLTLGKLLACIVVPFGAYVMGACAYRVRYGTGTDLSWSWAVLYLSVAACAVLLMLPALDGQSRIVDALLAVTVAAYIHITAPAWRHGVPHVAKPPQCICNPPTGDQP